MFAGILAHEVIRESKLTEPERQLMDQVLTIDELDKAVGEANQQSAQE
jgi:hypothetical protein